MSIVTHDAVCEAATTQDHTTSTCCGSDLVLVASAMLGATLGAILALLYAVPGVGGDYAGAVGTVGAMLGSGLFATITCGAYRGDTTTATY